VSVISLPIWEQEWRELALCRGLPPDLFYPDNDDNVTREMAKQVCHVCPVCSDCLEAALLESPQLGVRGGLSSRERIRLRARRNKGEEE
jgi:hypothetical protein